MEESDKSIADSDDETDAHLSQLETSSLPPGPVSNPSSTSPSSSSTHPFHQIDIRQASSTTYSALICYLETGFIHFAPLSCSFSPSSATPQPSVDPLDLPSPNSTKRPLNLHESKSPPSPPRLSQINLPSLSFSLPPLPPNPRSRIDQNATFSRECHGGVGISFWSTL